MKKYLWLLLIAAFFILYFSIVSTASAKCGPRPTKRCGYPKITVTPTPSSTATATPTPTARPTPTRTPTPTPSRTPGGYYKLVLQTNPAANITSTSARVSGTVTLTTVGQPIATVSSVQVGFAYWEPNDPNNKTIITTIPFTYSYPVSTVTVLANLKPNTIYNYAIIVNQYSYGNIESFTTLPE